MTPPPHHHHGQPLISCLRKLSEEWNYTHELYNAQRLRTLTLLETVNRERLYSYFYICRFASGRELKYVLLTLWCNGVPPPPNHNLHQFWLLLLRLLLTQQTTLIYESYLKHKNTIQNTSRNLSTGGFYDWNKMNCELEKSINSFLWFAMVIQE